jgi:hypothetical protein
MKSFFLFSHFPEFIRKSAKCTKRICTFAMRMQVAEVSDPVAAGWSPIPCLC